jgi:hypothetical protein
VGSSRSSWDSAISLAGTYFLIKFIAFNVRFGVSYCKLVSLVYLNV